jgi:hypothetical protein
MDLQNGGLETSLKMFRLMKLDFLRSRGVRGADLPMIVVLRKEGVDLFAFTPEVRDRDAGHVLVIEKAIAMSDADEVMVCADVIMHVMPEEALDEYNRTYRHGDLQKEFRAGRPEFVEALQVCGSCRGGPVVSLGVPYTVEGRDIVWAEEQLFNYSEQDVVAQALIPNAMQRGFELQATRNGPPAPIADVADALGIALIVPRLPRPARNDPCPCGSGLKSKRCCWA